MKRFLKLVCVGLLVSLTLTFTNFAVSAKDDLTEDFTRWMNTAESFRVEVYLFENEPISGACSQDCYEIDLTLHDANTNKVVAQDHSNTTTPIVNAPYEGNFILDVEMANCSRLGGCRTWVRYGDELNPPEQ